MPLNILLLRHENARANKWYCLNKNQFKKNALYNGLVQDNNIFPIFRWV